jgi:hypothetical protein
MSIAPRSVSFTPVLSRPKPSTLAAKPIDIMTLSASIEPAVPSLAVYVTVTLSPLSVTVSTLVEVRMSTPYPLYWRAISFETSASSLGSARSRNSMIVTLTP